MWRTNILPPYHLFWNWGIHLGRGGTLRMFTAHEGLSSCPLSADYLIDYFGVSQQLFCIIYLFFNPNVALGFCKKLLVSRSVNKNVGFVFTRSGACRAGFHQDYDVYATTHFEDQSWVSVQGTNLRNDSHKRIYAQCVLIVNHISWDEVSSTGGKSQTNVSLTTTYNKDEEGRNCSVSWQYQLQLCKR